MSSTKCKSGRPLRITFDGLFFPPHDRYRVIDLEAREDRFVSKDDLISLLGQAKWDRVRSNLLIYGCHEAGRYRIEVA